MASDETTALDAALEARLALAAELHAQLPANAAGPQNAWNALQRATADLRQATGQIRAYERVRADLGRKMGGLTRMLENPVTADPATIKDDLAEARAVKDALQHLDWAVERVKAAQNRLRQSLDDAFGNYRRRACYFVSTQVAPLDPRIEHGPGGQMILQDDPRRKAAREPLESLMERLAGL